MTKSATDVMQEIIVSAAIDSIMALKAASKGLPNTLLRDLNAVHANTTFADLPKELQASIMAGVRTAFNRLQKEGYSVASGQPASSHRPAFGRQGTAPPHGQRKPQIKRGGADAKSPPLKGRRPTSGPKPKGAS